jgi:hypothetical protein
VITDRLVFTLSFTEKIETIYAERTSLKIEKNFIKTILVYLRSLIEAKRPSFTENFGTV